MRINDFVHGYVSVLSERKYSYSAIIARLKIKGVTISKKGIYNCLKMSKFTDEKDPNQAKKYAEIYTKKICDKTFISKVKTMALKENPPTQRAMANKLNTSVQIINKTIRVDLGLKKVKKLQVYRLTARHIAERKTNSRLLYENYLSREKWKNVVTVYVVVFV